VKREEKGKRTLEIEEDWNENEEFFNSNENSPTL